jgi:hypothetical protein
VTTDAGILGHAVPHEPTAPASTPVEAGVDAVYDMVEAFERTIDALGVTNEVYAEHQEHYVHLFIGGQTEDGFTDELARSIAGDLDAVVRPQGWFVAKCSLARHPDADGESEPQTMCYVDVFPLRGAVQAMGTFAYHLAPPACRDAIAAGGLAPRTGGNDHIVTANPRVYVAVDRIVVSHLEEDMARLRGWSELDVWQIDLALVPDHEWLVDVEMAEIGAWTPDAIPPSALRRVVPIGGDVFVPADDA